MKVVNSGWWGKVRCVRILSPAGLALRALLLAAGFAICEAAGLREHTTFLSGTAAAGGGGSVSVVWGVTYILAYLGFVLLVPIFLLAALWLVLWQEFDGRKRIARPDS